MAEMGVIIDVKPLDEKNSILALYDHKDNREIPLDYLDSMSTDNPELKAAQKLAWELFGGLPLAIAQAGSAVREKGITFQDYLVEWTSATETALHAALTDTLRKEFAGTFPYQSS